MYELKKMEKYLRPDPRLTKKKII